MKMLAILFNTLKILFQQYTCNHSNLVYDSQSFQIQDNAVILEDDLKIQLPLRLVGKNIKQIELIPQGKSFEVIFTYEQEQLVLNNIKTNSRMMSMDLSLENVATCTAKSMFWFLFMNKAANPRFL
jgi:transposase